MAVTIIAAIPMLIWLYLLFARGGYWRIRPQLGSLEDGAVPDVRVTAVVPARDEADVIGETVRSLLHQKLPTALRVVVVDDGSTDGTAEVAQAAAEGLGLAQNLRVITARPLPPGWTGKLWAVSQGVAASDTENLDYLLLTDADIRHDRRSIGRLIARAERHGFDLASYMVKLAADSPAEKILIPAFVYFFLQLYPPRWIRSNRRRTAGAAGGCILIRPKVLDGIGGISSIRNAVIDDCALARAVKRNGGKLWMGLTEESRSIRSYGGFGRVGRMISRSAFHQLDHSAALLVLTIVGLGLTYVLPPVLVATGKPILAICGGFAWVLMILSYLPMLRLYRQSPIWALSLPLIAAYYGAWTVHSAFQFWRGLGGKWKGRVQDVRKQ